ncbi:DoxX family protein [Streptomyces sp. 21So2-11]|uniref:DoxX family protein n=1 Tax=Streptomyces sp. 21So2-11 TaxID=3144408 RepID=UPI003218F857
MSEAPTNAAAPTATSASDTPVPVPAPAPVPVPASASVSASVSAPVRTGRRTNIAVRVLQVVLALLFAVPSALPKLIAHPSAAESFDKIGFGDWFMYLTGGLELAGAIALVIPILSGVSALALSGLMIGAFITQITVFDGENAASPLIVMALLLVVAWFRRHHNADLIALVRRRA